MLDHDGHVCHRLQDIVIVCWVIVVFVTARYEPQWWRRDCITTAYNHVSAAPVYVIRAGCARGAELSENCCHNDATKKQVLHENPLVQVPH
jgi:hypothetical protein